MSFLTVVIFQKNTDRSINIEYFAAGIRGRCKPTYCPKVFTFRSLDYRLLLTASLFLQELLYMPFYKENDSSVLAVLFKLD